MTAPAHRIESVEWQGDLDGEIALTRVDHASGAREELVLDRPGDLVVAMMETPFVREELLGIAGGYGLCVASRGISEPTFIRPILDKAVPFMASAEPGSIGLLRALHRVRDFAHESELEGVELRAAILDEVRRMHGEARGE